MLSTFHRQSTSLLARQLCRAQSLSSSAAASGAFRQQQQHGNGNKQQRSFFNPQVLFGASVAAAGALYMTQVMKEHEEEGPSAPSRLELLQQRVQLQAKEKKDKEKKEGDAGRPGERKFNEFASREFNGELFMTPADFLESLTLDRPKTKRKIRLLKRTNLNKMMKNTPTIGSYVQNHLSDEPSFLRELGDEGIISYAEYIFLLSLLTKPKGMVRVAFDIIDKSRENSIMQSEFLQFCQMASSKKSENRILMAASVDTSLRKHFFGLTGTGKLKFTEFSAFVQALQREVLRVEFLKYSRGYERINEGDFARMIFRYTDLSKEERGKLLDQLESRLPGDENTRPGISFDEVEQFFRLLNNMSEFAFAYQLHPHSGTVRGKEGFSHAAEVTLGGGELLSRQVVDVIFGLFDHKGNNTLNYEQFNNVVQNRLGRHARRSLHRKTGFKAFKTCMKEEVETIKNQL